MTIIRATIAVADLFSFFYRGVLSIILADALQSYDLAVYSHLIKMKSTFNRAVPMGYDQILILDLWKVYTTFHPLGGTPLQNHLYIEDESQNFDEMRAVASSSPARGELRNFSTVDLASSSTVHFGRGYTISIILGK